ncbi:MAG: hypothetical protein ACYS29_17180 [Planctomycetota bacterium]|jgi:uncharacterized membrane protein
MKKDSATKHLPIMVIVGVIAGVITQAIWRWPLLSVTCAVCTLILYFIWDHLCSFVPKRTEAKQRILVRAYLAVFLVAAFIPLYLTIIIWQLRLSFSTAYRVVIIGSVVAAVFLGGLLYRLIRQIIGRLRSETDKVHGNFSQQPPEARLEGEQVQQNLPRQLGEALTGRNGQSEALLRIHEHVMREHGGTLQAQYDDQASCVRVRAPDNSTRPIWVHCLRGTGLRAGQQLLLNAKTFSDGMHFLKEQIDHHRPTIQPQLCVGINITGGIIATFLLRAFRPGTRAGFIRTEGPKHEVVESLLPNEKNVETILVTDLEMRRGRSMKNAFRLLSKEYGPDVHIYATVLVASGVRDSIEHMDDLIQARAFVSEAGIRLYGNIR